ncbi:MAG: PAS domain S-box protein [Methanoregula sp.]
MLTLIAGVTIAAVALTLYCYSTGISTVFMHFYYLPIILIAYFYRRRGIPVFIGLSLLYFSFATFFMYPSMTEIGAAALRSGMFILIGVIVAELSERLEKKKDEYRIAHEYQKSIISNANVWLMVLDSGGRILEWNHAAEEISGYPALEIIGSNEIWKQLYPEKNYRKEITEKITEIIKQEKYLENLQTTIVSKNGTRKTLLWNTRGLPDSKGVIGNFIAIGVDISDREKVEQVSKEYAEWYSTLLRTTRDGYNLVDATGRLVEVNDNYCRMTGFTREELLGRLISDQDSDESKDVAFSHMQRILKTGSDRFETRHRTKGGEPIDVEVSVVLQAQKRQFIVFVRDITERKRAEKALMESEEEFHTIADFTVDWEYWQGQDKQIIYISPSCESFTGYTQQEFLADPHLLDTIVHPDDRALVQEHNTEAWETRQALSTEFRIVRRDGILRWIGHACRQVYDTEGKALGRRVSNRDITDQKIALQALRENEEKYHAFFTTSRDCVFITTPDGTWVDLNDEAISLFGYDSREELMQVAIRDLYANPPDRDAHISHIRKREYSLEYPVNLRKKDGTIINTLITAVARKDLRGNIISIQGSIRDITEKKIAQDRIEELLRLQEEQLRIINTSPAVAFLWKAEENWPVEMVSRNVSQFGYLVEDFLSGRVLYSSIIHPGDLERIGAEVAYNSTHNIDEFRQEYRIFGKDLSEFWIEDYTHIRRDITGKVTHFEGIIVDITERKRAEEEIKHAIERFRMVMDSIDAFVYVSDMQTYELLFLNKYGRDIWGGIEGKVCWQTIQSNQKGPCPFCTNEHLVDKSGNPTGIYNWEFKNTVNGRWYDCRDSAIRWLDGRLVRIEIATDITGRKETEEALQESEQKFRDLFENSRDGIVIADTRTRQIVDCNEMFSHMLGYHPEEIKNLGLMDIHPESDRARATEIFEKMARHEINIAENLPVKRKDGILFYADVSTYPINKSNKDYLVGVFRDITERKQAEELRKHFTEELEQQVRFRTRELENLLNEKNVILREVHHRVKNNFQIIISLLNLQSRDIGDERVSRAMRESQNRIRAMAFIHEAMYTSADLARIDLEPYIKYMTAQLLTFFAVRPGTISLVIDVKNIFVDINTAIPLGLVINELFSNSLKHAFPEGRTGKITIRILEDQNELTITYQDNGVGFREGFDWQTAESLGFKLIRVLIDQLDGTIKREPSTGSHFTIRLMKKTDTPGGLYGTFNRIPE